MADHAFFPDDLIVGRTRNGKCKIGVIYQVPGIDESDSEFEISEDERDDLQPGLVSVMWHPYGKREVLAESQLQLVDRSCLPRDVVRMQGETQLGTLISTQVLCDFFVLGTSKVLKGINIKQLKPFRPFGEGDCVTFGPWLGKVQFTSEDLVLRFPNGARGLLDTSIRDLYDMFCDIYPQPGDEGGEAEDPFYPGQYLIGTEKTFADIKWITDLKIKFKPKTRYRVLVEKVDLACFDVKWGSRGFLDEEEKSEEKVGVKIEGPKLEDCGSSVDPEPYNAEVEMKQEKNPAEPPSTTIMKKDFQKIRKLKYFSYAHNCVSQRLRYQLSEEDAEKLNKQKNKTSKKASRLKMAKRMEQKFRQGSNLSSTSLARKSGKGRRHENRAQHDSSESSSENDDSAYDEDDTAEMEEDDESSPSPSSGACASVVKEDPDVEVSVQAESDINIPSPAGQRPTILGVLSCRVAGFELDFSLIQEVAGVVAKRKFRCNIQNPECTREELEKISAKFLTFIKIMLKKNKNLLNAKSSSAMMSQCPLAIRTFMTQQLSICDQEIVFEYQTEGKRTSGIIDKDGKKVEVEYADGDLNPFTPPNPQERGHEDPEDTCNEFSLAKKQTGPNVHFHAGQWISVEITRTYTTCDIQWQDGTIARNISSVKLCPAHHVDDNDFCPGDFVVDKRAPERKEYYGVVLKADSLNRMAKIQWIENGKATTVEEVSVYEVADHMDLHFRISDIIVRISNSYSDDSAKQNINENQLIGELLRVTELGMLEVVWVDGSVSLVHPMDVVSICEDDDSCLDSSEDEFEDFDDSSWVTASSDSSPGSEPSNMGDNNDSSPPDVDFHPVSMEGAGEGVNVSQNPELNEPNDGGDFQPGMNNLATQANSEIGNEDNVGADVGERDAPEDDERSLAENELNSAQENSNSAQENSNLAQENSNSAQENSNLAPGLEEANIEDKEENTNQETAGSSKGPDDAVEMESHNLEVSSTSSSAFLMEPTAPPSHNFIKRSSMQSPPKVFLKAAQRDIRLLRTSLCPGIIVKAYEDRLDLLSVLIEGPDHTPYQDGIFAFDVYLPQDYPTAPPSVHYISYSPRLNPNLYEAGRVCVSLLGTWSGKGSERWTKDSTLLQVLLSIQGLILNSEPYYNEAGYEGHRGTAEGRKNSRCYNEMVILRLVQHMTSLMQNPPSAFEEEIKTFCSKHIALLHHRVSGWIEKSSEYSSTDGESDVGEQESDNIGFPLLPLSKGVMLSLKGRLNDLELAKPLVSRATND